MPKTAPLKTALSPGQTGSHVVASRHKLNLRRDLRWVNKRIRKFPRTYSQAVKKNPFQGRNILYLIG